MQATEYAEMLHSLHQRQLELEKELGAVKQAIQALAGLVPSAQALPNKKVDDQATNVIGQPSAVTAIKIPSDSKPQIGRFAAISMRWACLWMLSETLAGLTTPEVAEKLKTGGKSSSASNFITTVSAVLSNMKSRGEVDLVGGNWKLTSIGHQSWSAIKPKLLLSAI